MGHFISGFIMGAIVGGLLGAIWVMREYRKAISVLREIAGEAQDGTEKNKNNACN